MGRAVLAAIAALALAGPAVAQDDLAADFARLQSRLMAARSEVMARQAEVRRLSWPQPAGSARHCRISQMSGTRAARLRALVGDMAAHIIAANQLYIADFCGVGIAPDETYNAHSGMQKGEILDDDADESRAEDAAPKAVQVSLGVLRQAQDDSELAAVLGHELAHLVLDYPLATPLTVAAGQKIAADGSDSRYARPDAEAVNRWLSGYFLSAELEADRLGAILAARAGYDPRAMQRCLSRMQELVEAPGSKQARIDAFARELPEIESTAASGRPVLRLREIQRLLQ